MAESSTIWEPYHRDCEEEEVKWNKTSKIEQNSSGRKVFYRQRELILLATILGAFFSFCFISFQSKKTLEIAESHLKGLNVVSGGMMIYNGVSNGTTNGHQN
jgi:hypothetical protein